MAAAYAGGMDANELHLLAKLSGTNICWLGQGATFAAKARERAGNMAAHTDSACMLFLGLSATDAALITDQALLKSEGSGLEQYKSWRNAIHLTLSSCIKVES